MREQSFRRFGMPLHRHPLLGSGCRMRSDQGRRLYRDASRKLIHVNQFPEQSWQESRASRSCPCLLPRNAYTVVLIVLPLLRWISCSAYNASNDALQVDRLRTTLQITVGVRFNVKVFCYEFLRHPFEFPCLAQTRTNSFIVDIRHVYTSFSVLTRPPDCVIAVWTLGVHTF